MTMPGGIEAGRHPRRGARIATVAAFAALIAAPLVAGVLAAGTPVALLALPAESIAVLLILLALPGFRLRWLVATAYGVVVVLATVIAALDLGFQTTVDRPFSLAEDVSAVVNAYGVVRDAAGTVNAVLLVAGIAALAIAAVIALARAALRAGRVTARSGRTGRLAAAAAATAWIVCSLLGAQVVPGVPVAASEATSALAATSAQTALSIREQAAFERALAADDTAAIPAGELLSALEGKDVVIAFLESYGRVALEDPAISAGVGRVLAEGDAQLGGQGYDARSAFLTSPTFGGVSWLAHATLQSGMWVDSQLKYDRLTTGERFTLTRAFDDAGWRTVAVVPSNERWWDVGASFYGYDAVVDSRHMDYRGPAFSYARIPDQYTWRHFHDSELADAHAPVMAEIDFVSSHTPWTPIPQLVPWPEVGDAGVFAAQADAGPSPVEVWTDAERVREMYGLSVEYSLGAMFSFLDAYDSDDLVLVVLGDHQPARIVSGREADHDVPITIISKDPAVIAAIDSWGWDSGIRPSPEAPVWRMDGFRDRFLAAFSG